MTDTIVQEVRNTRAKLAARFDYDIGRIVDDAMARQNQKRPPTATSASKPKGKARKAVVSKQSRLPNTDSIVQEVRDIRAAIAAEFDYDHDRYFAWIKAKQEAERETHPTVSFADIAKPRKTPLPKVKPAASKRSKLAKTV